MNLRRLVIIGLLLGVLGIITAAVFTIFRVPLPGDEVEAAVASTEIALPTEFESNAFRFSYPETWRHNIPQQNMLFLASPEVRNQEVGASMTIQRSIRLTGEATSLDDALDIYLRRGALRSDRAWEIVEEAQAIVFANRDSLRIALEGAERAGDTLMRSEIYVTQANNELIYVFAISAPLEQWQAIQPTFQAVLDSITILE